MAKKTEEDKPVAQRSENARKRKTSHRLYLLRHAKSAKDDGSIPDKERPLTARGRKAAMAMRRLIRSKGIEPDLVLVSSSRRTIETLEQLKPSAKSVTVAKQEALYLASAAQLIDVLRGVDETVRSVLLIGHNPGIQELAIMLLGKDTKRNVAKPAQRMADAYPTCALATFELHCPWSQVGEGKGKLQNFIWPRDLKGP